MVKKIPLQEFWAAQNNRQSIPYFSSLISAGFPSPADDFLEKRVDIKELLVKNSASTYFFRVSGNSMKEAGIFNNDILVVDSSIRPFNHAIVVASVDGDLTVKRLVQKDGKSLLMPESKEKHYQPIELNSYIEIKIWGVCTFSIHDLLKFQ